ncbi:MAG: hypothetical protein H6868_04345 [Rhodospirillales bacterium]|nr:hypothetical protein [Rhodospirillales bacterium]
MMKFIVEAYSEESYEDAMAQALGKASSHLSRENDIHIEIIDLSYDEEKGYHVALEVTVVPMGDRDSFKIKHDEEQNRRQAVKVFRKLRVDETDRLKKMIFDHFQARGHDVIVPEFHHSWLSEADIANDIVENDFHNAAQENQDEGPKPEAPPVPPPLKYDLS